jgi:hypothetical protein
MSLNNGAGPGVLFEEDMAEGGRDVHSNRPVPLHNIRLLAEDAQLETKRSNEGNPSQSEASE